MLLPAKTEVARRLRRYRAWERMMLAAPGDVGVRATFEDSGYTLCVLMGERCAREAADAAERYLRAEQAAPVRERAGQPAAGLGAGPAPAVFGAGPGPAAAKGPAPALRRTPSGAA